MKKVGEIHGVKIYVTDGYEMVMSQRTFDAFRAFVESITPVMLPIAAQDTKVETRHSHQQAKHKIKPMIQSCHYCGQPSGVLTSDGKCVLCASA
jgi:hypothetical protein